MEQMKPGRCRSRTLSIAGWIIILLATGVGVETKRERAFITAELTRAGAGEAGTVTAPRKEPVRATIPAVSFAQLPLLAGAESGIFKTEGLDVSVEEMPPTATMAGLIKGEIQFTSAGSSALRAAASGVPVKLLTGGSEKPAFFLVAQPEIRRVADLRGKVIAVTSLRSLTDILTRDLLKQNGVDPGRGDAQIIALRDTANILAGLAAKQVQAGLLSPPFDYQARKMGLNVLLFAGDHIRLLQGGFASSNQQIAANPDMIRRFIRGYLRSIEWTQSQKARVVPAIMKIWKVDQETASQTYDAVKGIWRADGGVSREVLQKEIEMWKESTKATRDASVDDLRDFSFLRQAQQELNVKPLD